MLVVTIAKLSDDKDDDVVLPLVAVPVPPCDVPESLTEPWSPWKETPSTRAASTASESVISTLSAPAASCGTAPQAPSAAAGWPPAVVHSRAVGMHVYWLVGWPMTQQIGVSALQLSVSHEVPVPPVVSPESATAPLEPPDDEPPDDEPPELVAASVASAEPSSATAASNPAS